MKPYQYDPNKANANLKKHGISFDEAYTALLDEQALVMPDPDALDEERFVGVKWKRTTFDGYLYNAWQYAPPDFSPKINR